MGRIRRKRAVYRARAQRSFSIPNPISGDLENSHFFTRTLYWKIISSRMISPFPAPFIDTLFTPIYFPPSFTPLRQHLLFLQIRKEQSSSEPSNLLLRSFYFFIRLVFWIVIIRAGTRGHAGWCTTCDLNISFLILLLSNGAGWLKGDTENTLNWNGDFAFALFGTGIIIGESGLMVACHAALWGFTPVFRYSLLLLFIYASVLILLVAIVVSTLSYRWFVLPREILLFWGDVGCMLHHCT